MIPRVRLLLVASSVKHRAHLIMTPIEVAKRVCGRLAERWPVDELAPRPIVATEKRLHLHSPPSHREPKDRTRAKVPAVHVQGWMGPQPAAWRAVGWRIWAHTRSPLFARARRSHSNNALISAVNSRNFKKVHGLEQRQHLLLMLLC